jgi:TET-associated glycosyltransferase-like protein
VTVIPRYPIYVPSKGRAGAEVLTARMFSRDAVPFRLVVEPSQVSAYAKAWGKARLLVLPEDGKGLVYARNWIKDHATAAGHARHWQFDDDVQRMVRLHRGYRVPCAADVALAAAEDFVDRYENVALASFNSEFFVRNAAHGTAPQRWPPFYQNARCYTCFLISNAIPNRWRGRYNEDTDMTLQVLADGHCTLLFNAFLMWTPTSVTEASGAGAATGGQKEIYVGQGRLKMARELERRWPGVVEVRQRFGRAQHYVRFHWQKFDTPLRLRADAAPVRDYGLTLKVVGKNVDAARATKADIERTGD